MSHPFIPVPNCASVEFIYSYGSVTCENQIHVSKGSPFTLAQLQALRGVAITWFTNFGRGMSTGNLLLVRVRSKALDTSSSPMEDFLLATPIAGTASGTSMPGGSTLAIKLATGLSGRSFRGRWYIVGLGTANYGVDQNNMSSIYCSVVTGYLNQLQASLLAAGYTLGVVSYRTGNAYRTTGLFTASTGWVSVDTHIDSMRRRLQGRGI